MTFFTSSFTLFLIVRYSYIQGINEKIQNTLELFFFKYGPFNCNKHKLGGLLFFSTFGYLKPYLILIEMIRSLFILFSITEID
jgi:hypothetical protein